MTTTPRRFRLASKGAMVRLLILGVTVAVALGVCWFIMIRQPGSSFRGPFVPAGAEESALATALRRDVETLALEIGPRNRMHGVAYERAADFIEDRLKAAGLATRRMASPPAQPHATPGIIEATRPGSTLPKEIIVLGAHYDSFDVSPGANDNGTGVAALLALAERMAAGADGAASSSPAAALPTARTIRFVFFPDEEPPFFQTDEMGSLVYARACRTAGDDVVAMFSLETMGYFSDRPGSQQYPQPLGALYPDTGNFVGFVSNVRSRALLREAIGAFRETTELPSEGAALPPVLPGIGWSDHWSFWQAGYPGLMVTDTAPFRYPYYHTTSDLPKHLDFERVARVVLGIERVVRRIDARPTR